MLEYERGQIRVEKKVIGLIHPGEMGAAVGAALTSIGQKVLWAASGRSDETKARALAANLEDVSDLDELARSSDLIISIVPPHGAVDMARQMAGKTKLYVDANALSPDTTIEIEKILSEKGTELVDGGIVGPPPTKAGVTRLYLSGNRANEISGLFEGSLVEAPVLKGGAGAASAMKMCYGGWTKGSDALLLALLTTARHLGVEEALRSEWSRSKPELTNRLYGAGWAAGRKGWRWVGEMEEIAKTMKGAGMPSGFHLSAADIFERSFHDPNAGKDEKSLSEIIKSLLTNKSKRNI
jgi:3-hydroxyisobutyrate dehydrogenase-like beta-hydroxyacid dehydrogenase